MGERIKLRKEKPGARVNHKTVGLNKTKSQSNQSPVDRILNLQKTIGNQAVTRLMRTGAIQASLKIGQPGDIYEKEADRVADQVMRMRMPERGCPECEEQVEGVQRQVEEEEEEKIQTKPLSEQITPLVQRQAVPEEEEEPVQAKLMENQQLQRQEEEEEEISRKASGNSAAVSSDIESRIQAMKGGGQPLSESTRAFFEPRFGADFSQVRVHTGSAASETAKAINASAFTTGRDIVFGSGQYSPGTFGGKRLLAHELTHTIQQGNLSMKRVNLLQPQVEEEEGPVVIPQGRSIAPYLHLKRKTSNLDIPGKRSLQPLYPLQTSPLDIIRRATTPDGEDTGPTDAGKTFCRRGTYLGIFSVGSNTASAATGKATISSRGHNSGRVGGKSCSCDCGLLRQYIKGYWRWGRGGAKRHNITSCGNNINISESSWTEEYLSCILNKNNCRQNYSDYPGWNSGLSNGTYVELRYNFKYQLWDKCQGRANTVAYNTLTISGSRAPRRIRWSRT